MVVARTGDIDQLDPQKATAFQTVETLSLVYGRLVALDQDGKLVPDLASKWSTSADGKTLSFTLRSGVSWQDGDPFTAADVKASLERILDEKTAAVARSNLSSITKIDAADGTVTLTLSGPSTALLYSLASVNAAILHDKDIQANTIAKTPDGTGPFSWKSWAQGQQVVLAANPSYWAGAPKIGTVQFRVIPAESSIVSGMKAGAFQIGLLSDPTVADNAGSSDRFQLVKQPTLAYHALMLNGRRGPLQKLEVRQAIACAVDRDQVVKTAANGDGTVTGPITSPGFSYSPTEGLPCTPGDTAAAKKMLADAGYPDGFSLHTIVETGEYATAVAEGQNLQAQLKAIGVTLDLQQLTTDPYVKAWLAADFDAAVALNGGSYDPYLMYGRYFTQGGSLSGPAGLESPTLASLLVKGNTSTDDAQRQTTYRDLQQELLKESPWVWLFRSQDFYLVGSGVSFTPRADGLLSSLAAS
ncbi:ABC transporter substrate-binding protein [Nakamurella endophytica]|uniref:ABC transporter substrate-binding protein n=1 Tax=Nakamurella endophytica TaxID=1748367 RepID=A0A917SL89_9ACTN|nr:ABC transporter substrate-binding protein [Nakamurella endophytica]